MAGAGVLRRGIAALPAIFFLGREIFVRDFRLRYRRALLGVLWSVSPIVVLTGAAFVLAGEVATSFPPGNVPYPLLVVTGLILWGVFADGVTGPTQICRRSRSFLRRTPLDHGALLVASSWYQGFHLALKLPVLIGLFAWFGVQPGAGMAWSLPFILALGLFGLALGALVAPLSLVYLDVRYGLPFALLLLMVATPVLYPVQESGPLYALSRFNPVSHLLVTARDCLLGEEARLLSSARLTAMTVVGLILPLCLAYYYRAMPRGLVHI